MKPNNWKISQDTKDLALEARIKAKSTLSLSNESPMRLFSADRKYQAGQLQPNINDYQPSPKGQLASVQEIQQIIDAKRSSIQFQQMNNGGQIPDNMNQITRQFVSSPSMNFSKSDSYSFQSILNNKTTELEVNSQRDNNKYQLKPASAVNPRENNYATNNTKISAIGVGSSTITSKQNYYLPTSLTSESPQINHLSNQQNRSNLVFNSQKESFNPTNGQSRPSKSPQYGQMSFNEMQVNNKSQSYRSLNQFDINSPKERQKNIGQIVRTYQQPQSRQQPYSAKYAIGNNFLRETAQGSQTPAQKQSKVQSFHSSQDQKEKNSLQRQSQEELRSVSQSQQWPINREIQNTRNTYQQMEQQHRGYNGIERSQNKDNIEEKQKINSKMNTPISQLSTQSNSTKDKIQQPSEEGHISSEQKLQHINTVNSRGAAHNQDPGHQQNNSNSFSMNKGLTAGQTNQTSRNIPNLTISSTQLPSASFTQLKSPITQTKMFLSPQSKWTLYSPEENGISSARNAGSNSVNNKKQTAAGGGRNIFSLNNQSQESTQVASVSRNKNESEPQTATLSNSENNLNLNKNNSSVPGIIENSQSLNQLPKQFSLPIQQNTPSQQKQSFSNHSEQGVTNIITPKSLEQPGDDIIPFQSLTSKTISAQEMDQIRSTVIPNHELTKFSLKRNGIIKSYAANTNQGLIRNYNEDRVSIILNIMKPQGKDSDQDIQWPKCSFFGVYDGHGGVSCADFLRDNLHQFVIKNENFPKYPKLALQQGFEAAEAQFLKQAQKHDGTIERSGSCAIVVMIVGKRCFVANVGDSRAILSGNSGTKAYDLSRDHKPLDDIEQTRIAEAGGRIYQTKLMGFQNISPSGGIGAHKIVQPMYGPHRVLPGRLSVTRTFGDIEAKLLKLGGNPNVVIAVPDIKEFDITSEHDFIMLASDGIYDKLSTTEVIESIWTEAKSQQSQYKSVHEFSGLAVDTVLKFGLFRKTMDNITVVIIGFDNLKNSLFQPRKKQELTISPEKLSSKQISFPSNGAIQSTQLEGQYNLYQNPLAQYNQVSSDQHNPSNRTQSQQKQTLTVTDNSFTQRYQERKNISNSPLNKSSKVIKVFANEQENQENNLLKSQQICYQSPLSRQQDNYKHQSQFTSSSQQEAKLIKTQTERAYIKNQISSSTQSWRFHLNDSSSQSVRGNPSSNGLVQPIRLTESRSSLQSNLSMEKDKLRLITPSYGVTSTGLSDSSQNKLPSQRIQQYQSIPLQKY